MSKSREARGSFGDYSSIEEALFAAKATNRVPGDIAVARRKYPENRTSDRYEVRVIPNLI